MGILEKEECPDWEQLPDYIGEIGCHTEYAVLFLCIGNIEPFHAQAVFVKWSVHVFLVDLAEPYELPEKAGPYHVEKGKIRHHLENGHVHSMFLESKAMLEVHPIDHFGIGPEVNVEAHQESSCLKPCVY